MYSLKNNVLLLLMLVFCSTLLMGQDVEQVMKSPFVKTNGGLNLSSSYLKTNRSQGEYPDALTWICSGNINFKFLGFIDAPFSYSISGGNEAFNQPSYQRFGISPKYKWITVHAGYRSLNLSSYSLSGLSFLGGAVELKPKSIPLEFSFMYGKLANGRSFQDSIKNIRQIESYDRWAMGGKLKLGKGVHNLSVLGLKVEDVDKDVIDADSLINKPAENLVLGIGGKTTVLKKINLQLDYTLSAYSNDKNAPRTNINNFSYLNNLGNLFTPRTSTSYDKVIAASVGYGFNSFNINLQYKRIDPGFRSLGTSYIANDVEDYTIAIANSFFQNKVSISASFGKQRDNLSKEKENTSTRNIANVSVNLSLIKNLALSYSYSNFNSESRPVYLNLVDSVKYAQFTKNNTLSANYNFKTSSYNHGLFLMYSLQIANVLDNNAMEVQETNSNVNNVNGGYRLNITSLKLSINTSYSYSNFDSGDSETSNNGPVIGLRKPFFNNRLQVGFNQSLLQSKTSNSKGNTNISRIQLSYKYGKHHSLRFNAVYSQRKMNDGKNQNNHSDLRFNLAYSFVF